VLGRKTFRQVDAFFLESRPRDRLRIPGRVKLDFRDPPGSGWLCKEKKNAEMHFGAVQ